MTWFALICSVVLGYVCGSMGAGGLLVDICGVPAVLAGVVSTAMIQAHKDIVASGMAGNGMWEDCSSVFDVSTPRN